MPVAEGRAPTPRAEPVPGAQVSPESRPGQEELILRLEVEPGDAGGFARELQAL